MQAHPSALSRSVQTWKPIKARGETDRKGLVASNVIECCPIVKLPQQATKFAGYEACTVEASHWRLKSEEEDAMPKAHACVPLNPNVAVAPEAVVLWDDVPGPSVSCAH